MKRFRRFPVSLFLTIAVLLAIPFIASADDISNNLDATVDAVAEVMPLTVGGADGVTQLYVVPRNGDGKNGCNLTGSTMLVVSVSSSNESVATVSPSSVTFTSCGDTPTLTVKPVAEGSATISLGQTSNDTGGTFNLAPAAFTVNVAPPLNTAPTVKVTGVTGGASYEFGSVPTATCEVTDAEDGNLSFPATLSAISGPLADYGLGVQTASCSYTDAGGLTAVASESYGIVDTTAPVITFVGRTPANGNGWNNGDVTVEWSCSDSGSGVVEDSISQTVSAEGADQSATGTCVDNAGNEASDTQSGINIDKTAPTASASASPAPNVNGWNNTDVTVSFSGSDGLSGIDFCDEAVVLGEGAGQSASGTCADKAGNVSDFATVSGINVDKTGPTLNPSVSPNPVKQNDSATASANASDELSGVASSSCDAVDTSAVGSKSVSCTATDNAGNSASASATYSVIYNFAGFFRPVDNPPTLNVAKAGSAIPVKFSLSGYQGLNIFAAGYPKSQVVSCDAGAPVDGVDVTVTAGNSSLSYDASTDQYNYVWKTEKTWTNCRQLVVKLNDGETYWANFKFTK